MHLNFFFSFVQTLLTPTRLSTNFSAPKIHLSKKLLIPLSCKIFPHPLAFVNVCNRLVNDLRKHIQAPLREFEKRITEILCTVLVDSFRLISVQNKNVRNQLYLVDLVTHTEDQKICFISQWERQHVCYFTKQRQTMPCTTVSAGVYNVHSDHKIYPIVISFQVSARSFT